MAQGLQIGQVARETGLSVDAIRFYEKQQLLKHPPRTEGGFRLFSANDVHSIQFIRRAQELGFSLSEIRGLLMIRSGEVAACSHVRDLLRTKLGSIRAKLVELRNLERQLAADLKKCENTLRRGKSGRHDSCPVLDEFAGPNIVRAGS